MQLRDDCLAFDGGKEYQAKQIATVVRVLVHQTGNSHALLNQLGYIDDWRWADTSAEIDPQNLMMTFGLVTQTTHMPEGNAESWTTYAPWLDGYPRVRTSRISAFSTHPIARIRGTDTPFNYWWNNPVVRDLAGTEFARKNLVLNLAHLEGGAHAAPKVPAHYQAFAHDGTMALPVNESDSSLSRSTASPVPACVRQIGFEVLKTIEHYRPDLAPDQTASA
jgi:hypothetical protein